MIKTIHKYILGFLGFFLVFSFVCKAQDNKPKSTTDIFPEIEGTFIGDMVGNAKGSGRLLGNVSVTVVNKIAVGTFLGQSETGDSFKGTISGDFDGKTGKIKANYKGIFNRVLGGRDIGAVSFSGPFQGTLNESTLSGTWTGRASGTWNATKAAYPATGTCADNADMMSKAKHDLGAPQDALMKTLLALSLEQIRKYEAMTFDRKKKYSKTELEEIQLKLTKASELFNLIRKNMWIQHNCKMTVIKGI